jgi:hypothetical protein
LTHHYGCNVDPDPDAFNSHLHGCNVEPDPTARSDHGRQHPARSEDGGDIELDSSDADGGSGTTTNNNDDRKVREVSFPQSPVCTFNPLRVPAGF